MKKDTNKVVIFGIVMLFMISGSISTADLGNRGKNEHLIYTFSFQEPQTKEVLVQENIFTKITMSGCLDTSRTLGGPSLPVKFIQLLLPPKTTIKNINVVGKATEINTQSLSLDEKPVIPYQNPVPIGHDVTPQLAFDTELYTLDSMYPKTVVENQQIGYCRGYTILSLALNPMQYLPEEGRLLYYPSLTLSIELEENGYVNPFYRDDSDDRAWVESLVLNPELSVRYEMCDLPVAEYPGGICDPSEDYDYVIITVEENNLHNYTTSDSIPYNWTSLMNKHKQVDGLNCTIVTLSDIFSTDEYFPDDIFDPWDVPYLIREFCRDAYSDWGTQYILIAGDDDGGWPEGTNIDRRILRYEDGDINGPYDDPVPSDIYWTHLDNTFGGFESEELYGWGYDVEYFDAYSEMYSGSIPCDEPQDVSNWLTKSFFYDEIIEQEYLENAGFYAGYTGWPCQGDDHIDFSAIKGTSDWLGPIPGEHGPYPDSLGFLYGFETWNQQNPEYKYNLSVKWTAEYPNEGWSGFWDPDPDWRTNQATYRFRDKINSDQLTLISAVAHANPHMSMDVFDKPGSHVPYDYYGPYWEYHYENTKPFFLYDWGCRSGRLRDAEDGVLHSMLFESNTNLAFACIYNTGFGWGSWLDTNSSSALMQKLFWDYIFDVNNNSKSPANWTLGKAQEWSRDMMAPTINWTYDFYGTLTNDWHGTIESCHLFGDPAQRLRKPLNSEEHYRTFTRFPMIPAEESDMFDYNQLCGAAVAQTILDWVCWNSDDYPTGPISQHPNQEDFFDHYGTMANWNDNLQYTDTMGMSWLLNVLKPDHEEYGYYFIPISDTDPLEALKQICVWMDYPVGYDGFGPKPDHPTNVPAIFPAYGNYSNWMVIRGLHTDKSAWPIPEELTVYGFWISDPHPDGNGMNTYVTSDEFLASYYDPLDIPGVPPDPYNGNYVAIIDPPANVDLNTFGLEDVELFTANSPKIFTNVQARVMQNVVRNMNDAQQDVSDSDIYSTIMETAADAIRPILNLDKSLKQEFSETTPIHVLIVDTLEGDDYGIAIFGSKLMTFAVRINLGDGSLLEFAVSEEKTTKYLQKLGVEDNDLVTYCTYDSGSRFYPTPMRLIN